MFDRKAPKHQKSNTLPPKNTSMATSRTAEVVPSHQEISLRASELSERAGRQDGRDQRDWFAAEREIVGRK